MSYRCNGIQTMPYNAKKRYNDMLTCSRYNDVGEWEDGSTGAARVFFVFSFCEQRGHWRLGRGAARAPRYAGGPAGWYDVHGCVGLLRCQSGKRFELPRPHSTHHTGRSNVATCQQRQGQRDSE